ncbi:MAG: hypothetical protein QW806_10400 [Nitrososphaerota archaeon]
MNDIQECLSFLEEISEKSRSVINYLKKKDLVQKSLGLYYEIDDTEVYKNIGSFPEGSIPYSAIFRSLRNSQKEIINLFNDSYIVPFSNAVKAMVGECLEKAILVQLSAQTKRRSFLILGYLGIDNEVGLNPHAFNIVLKDNFPYLIDAQNPIILKSGEIVPYIVPILGINREEGFFLIPTEWQFRRKYFIY